MMGAAIVQVQPEPARERIRDSRGVIVGVIERQQLVGKLIARDSRGVLVGIYDERSRATRDARGRLLGQTNLLRALLFQSRR
ncbi:MAG TPA: hypothetical protein VGO06_01715 [Bosea sp. (in: a-proteobacteria)]|jgi:hypothetical protein|uniref:hypothetical protein n=1 Tax=Bosea sp. (in: a-proteobacteria) TaxID=1871050 RepID=UPI002E15BF6D|nr:hypothetical protein [Bosea sp. (in: a-proteobacteria)]